MTRPRTLTEQERTLTTRPRTLTRHGGPTLVLDRLTLLAQCGLRRFTVRLTPRRRAGAGRGVQQPTAASAQAEALVTPLQAEVERLSDRESRATERYTAAVEYIRVLLSWATERAGGPGLPEPPPALHTDIRVPAATPPAPQAGAPPTAAAPRA